MMKQVVSVFTFQYGSTSMKLYYEAHVQDIGIYIPIWFYFNGKTIFNPTDDVLHLHSNMVLLQW